MELQTLAILVAIASPVIMTAVTWGSFRARLHQLEKWQERHENQHARRMRFAGGRHE